MVRVFQIALVAAVVLAGATANAAVTGVPGAPHVLIVGDSVGTGMSWHADAIAVMQANLNVDWHVQVCRRLVGVSCEDAGNTPQTALALIDGMSSVPPIVVVEMGYNDYEDTFAQSIDETMQTLVDRGAQHVLWLTLRASRDPYPVLNELLDQATARWPQLQLVDWNDYSAGHPDWFQTDGVHLLDAGGVAMAHLVHGAVVGLYAPLHEVPAALPALHRGKPYSTQLRAAGGTGPYHWRIAAGAPPAGLHLLADGRLFGRPRSHDGLSVSVEVTDADGVAVVAHVRARQAAA